jgi:hypothetical protein
VTLQRGQSTYSAIYYIACEYAVLGQYMLEIVEMLGRMDGPNRSLAVGS